MNLRTYQVEAIDKARSEHAKGKRAVLLQAPTGSGKGVILSDVIRKATERGSRVLFIVHRREILFQVSEKIKSWGVEHGIILAGEKPALLHKVQLASIQTFSARTKKPASYIPPADLIIIDEAHHSTAPTYRKMLELYPKAAILGFTATPATKQGFGLGNIFDAMVQASTIQTLTDEGWLVPIRYFAPFRPNLKGVRIQAGDYVEGQLEAKMNTPRLVGDIVSHWVRLAEGRPTVVFATGIGHSNAILQEFRSHGIGAEHLDGTTPKPERSAILERFRNGETKIITNCMVLTEGVDIPAISCVVLARPTKSLALYMQACGRGMRPFEGKQDMILIDHAGACYEHGFVHEITDWKLSHENRNENGAAEIRKKSQAEPVKCPNCDAFLVRTKTCSHCGWAPPASPKYVTFANGQLGEVQCDANGKVKVKGKDWTETDARNFYAQLLTWAHSQGYKPGWAAYMYKTRFGQFPKYRGVVPQPLSTEVWRWLTYRRKTSSGQGAEHA